jgi:hypothetical protein
MILSNSDGMNYLAAPKPIINISRDTILFRKTSLQHHDSNNLVTSNRNKTKHKITATPPTPQEKEKENRTPKSLPTTPRTIS